jgi:hypothetical protein
VTAYSFWYSASGLLVGFGFLFGGVILVWQGRHSNSTWLLTLGPMRIEISTGAPGVILATLGLLVIYVTRLGA